MFYAWISPSQEVKKVLIHLASLGTAQRASLRKLLKDTASKCHSEDTHISLQKRQYLICYKLELGLFLQG